MTDCFLPPQFNTCKLFKWLLTCIKKKNVSLANLHICTKFNCSATKSTRQSERELRWDNVSAAPGKRETLVFVHQSGDFCVKHNLTAYSLSKKHHFAETRAGSRANEITYSHKRHKKTYVAFFACVLLLGKIRKKAKLTSMTSVLEKTAIRNILKTFFHWV